MNASQMTPSPALWWPVHEQSRGTLEVVSAPPPVHVAAHVPPPPSLVPACADTSSAPPRDALPPLSAAEAQTAVSQLARLQRLRAQLPSHLPPAVRAARAGKHGVAAIHPRAHETAAAALARAAAAARAASKAAATHGWRFTVASDTDEEGRADESDDDDESDW